MSEFNSAAPSTTRRFLIPPPPESVYSSESEAIAALHHWTLGHGFNDTKRRAFYTDEDKTTVWKRGFDCDRSGKPKCTHHLTEEERVRTMRGSKRIDCGMTIIVQAVSREEVGGPWKIVHTRNKSEVHSHPPSRDPRVHASHRQRAG
jgi:hypothetical protein